MPATLSNTAVNDVAMVASNQADVDAAFADMEHLLADERPVPVAYAGTCVSCGDSNFVYSGPSSGHPGCRVCDSCGVVENVPVYWETMYGNYLPTKSSNYKRIHHWHERISQLLLMESSIPPAEMLQIAEKLCDTPSYQQRLCPLGTPISEHATVHRKVATDHFPHHSHSTAMSRPYGRAAIGLPVPRPSEAI